MYVVSGVLEYDVHIEEMGLLRIRVDFSTILRLQIKRENILLLPSKPS